MKGDTNMSDDADRYYSKRNPNGPYANRTRPDASAPKERYIEGFAKNLSDWTDYSLRNSDDPTISKKK
jgi:hypothetical protein